MRVDDVVKTAEIEKYQVGGKDFIDAPYLTGLVAKTGRPDLERVREIVAKSLSIQSLSVEETAVLMKVDDPAVWEELFAAAAAIKRKVYDNRVVTFAPLYCSNLCVNNCAYCGFRSENGAIQRRQLTLEEVAQEVEVLAGEIGHKRLIAVFGEHPKSGADYIAAVLRTIYSVRGQEPAGRGEIRRVNVNAAPMSIADLAKIKEAGIGTYQVFQETYHPGRYAEVHPAHTIKGHYSWRLYAHHRAMDAGIDDVATGPLLGLYDWRFEVLGMVAHALDLERLFGIGPHTVSVPRIEPATNTPFVKDLDYRVSDEDFRRIVALLRLSIPYAGLIVTCRERPEMIRQVLPMCTQRDASSRIGIGAYKEAASDSAGRAGQEGRKQQFMLTDTRSLDTVIRELAGLGYITSFCTAGYRCGRTGKNIMQLLRTGKEGCFCKLNAVLTYQEWLDDYGSAETKAVGEGIIERELAEIAARVPADFPPQLHANFLEYHRKIKSGVRDLAF